MTYTEWLIKNHDVQYLLEHLEMTIYLNESALAYAGGGFAGSPDPHDLDPRNDIYNFIQKKFQNLNQQQVVAITDFITALGASATICLGSAGCIKAAQLLGMLQ